MIKRDIEAFLERAVQMFPAVAVVGPRQSGKTTLVRAVCKDHNYVSLEDLDNRQEATSDPRHFLEKHTNDHGVILDEIQHAPGLLSYIQTIVDRDKRQGRFIITGSQNLLVSEAITQTLAGRVAWLTLFPLSIHELKQAGLLTGRLEDYVFQGGYPRIYDQQIPAAELQDYYIRGYIERDVRQIKNILDLNQFQMFVKMCAGRVGQILNISSLASDCGIDQKTARSWLSLLEATYVIFLLNPYYKNFGKRLMKSPKLYFVDTGIACSLLNIKSSQELALHYNWGGLVESFIISDLYKQFYNLNQKPTLYFWRDHKGNEVDVILEQALTLTPIEVKAGKTMSPDMFKYFDYLNELKDFPAGKRFVVYGGQQTSAWSQADVVSWQDAGELVRHVIMP